MAKGLIPQWSYSRLKDYEKCPYMLWLKVGEKRKVEVDPESKGEIAKNRGIVIHNDAELFVNGEGDFTKGLAKFADYFKDLKVQYEAGDVILEDDWGFTEDWQPCGYWDDEVWLRMKLDNFITVTTNEEEILHACATDYKSGKKYGNEVSHNQQGQLYVLGSFFKYPTLEICDVDFKYLDHGISSKPKRYTRQKAMKFLQPWDARAKRMTNATEFPPKANKITCRYCPFGPQNGDGSCEWGVDA